MEMLFKLGMTITPCGVVIPTGRRAGVVLPHGSWERKIRNRKIVEARLSGETLATVGVQFGLSRQAVWKICNRSC